MIPKIIHYCWFGRGKKPLLTTKCLQSWIKHCPDYHIIEWNEDNFDISSAPLFVQEAMKHKIYPFVSDYVRYYVVYTYGGIYLDTDVELIKPLDSFLTNKAYFGFCKQNIVGSGVGFGAEKGLYFLQELMSIYEKATLIKNGAICYETNTSREQEVFQKHGLISNGKNQVLDNDVRIYPEEFFAPYDYKTDSITITDQTTSIHWWSQSLSDRILKSQRRKKLKSIIKHPFSLFLSPLERIIGKGRYERLRSVLSQHRKFY